MGDGASVLSRTGVARHSPLRRVRKGDTVRLRQGVFLGQDPGLTARVQCVYHYRVHVTPSLHAGYTDFRVCDVERVLVRKSQGARVPEARKTK